MAPLSARCSLEKITFPLGKNTKGRATLGCIGAMRMELQFYHDMLLKKINHHFGYDAVEKITFVSRYPDLPKKSQRSPLELAPLHDMLDGIDDTLSVELRTLHALLMGKNPMEKNKC